MSKWLIAVFVVAVLAGCGNSTPTASKPKHNYTVQDGMKYGYPAAISENNKKAGQVAEKLVMAMYAGQRDGKHQVHIMDGNTVTAVECAAPCNYIKTMTYVDNPLLSSHVNVQHMAGNPNSLAYLMLQDASNGLLKQYAREVNGKRYSMWVNERKGMQRTMIN